MSRAASSRPVSANFALRGAPIVVGELPLGGLSAVRGTRPADVFVRGTVRAGSGGSGGLVGP